MNTQALKDTWILFQREHKVSVDEMLCRPSLRTEYLAAARLATGVDDEEQLLWNTMHLRKNKSLPSVLR